MFIANVRPDVSTIFIQCNCDRLAIRVVVHIAVFRVIWFPVLIDEMNRAVFTVVIDLPALLRIGEIQPGHRGFHVFGLGRNRGFSPRPFEVLVRRCGFIPFVQYRVQRSNEVDIVLFFPITPHRIGRIHHDSGLARNGAGHSLVEVGRRPVFVQQPFFVPLLHHRQIFFRFRLSGTPGYLAVAVQEGPIPHAISAIQNPGKDLTVVGSVIQRLAVAHFLGFGQEGVPFINRFGYRKTRFIQRFLLDQHAEPHPFRIRSNAVESKQFPAICDCRFPSCLVGVTPSAIVRRVLLH
ncbi:hypothetical protein D3C74_289240 [compost metagenome]